MIFRRRDSSSDSQSDEAPGTVAGAAGPLAIDPSGSNEGVRRSQVGPWDVAERPAADDPDLIDLGGLLVRGRPGLELRLQTDQATGAVVAAMLVSKDGAAELRSFAARRSGGIWEDVRRDIASEAARRGGTATEAEGEYGKELRVVVPVQTPDGRAGTQASRVVGIEGPRWLLRVTYLGGPATSSDPDHVLVSAIRDVVVVRGEGAMAPREPIPLRLPPHAHAIPQPAE